MSTNEKAATQAARPGAASNTAFSVRNSTATDPLKGWFDLAAGVKPSRTRQQKKSWNRGRR